MTQQRVFITGSGGYVGSVLVPHLVAQGYKVIGLDKYNHKHPGLLACCSHPNFEPVRGDCRDNTLLKECLKDVDTIIPLAAIVGVPACDLNTAEAWSINYDAVANLLYLKSKEQRLLFPNTNSGYGTTKQDEVCDEDTPLKPISTYGLSKKRAEDAVLSYSNTLAFRFATAFGPSPRMRIDLLVNDFVYRAVTDKTVVLYEPHFRRNVVHVQDIARAFHFAIEHFDEMKSKVYNVGLPFTFTKDQICDTIKEQLPDFQYFIANTGKDPDKRDYDVSVKRIADIGFTCEKTLAVGIWELIKVYTMFPGREFTNL